MPGSHDASADSKWLHSPPSQFIHEFRRRRGCKHFPIFTAWPVKDRAILRNNSVKDRVVQKNFLQLLKLSSRRQNQFPAGRPHLLESLHSARPTSPLVSNRAVIITNYTEAAHAWLLRH